MDGNGSYSLLYVAANTNVTVHGLVFSNGYGVSGADAYSAGNLTLDSVNLYNGKAASYGGGLFVASGGDVSIKGGSLINSCQAANSGGGVDNQGTVYFSGNSNVTVGSRANA